MLVLKKLKMVWRKKFRRVLVQGLLELIGKRILLIGLRG